MTSGSTPALKVTYLTLPHQSENMLLNVGDRVIYRGVRNIMHAALGPHREEVRLMTDHEPFPEDTDVLVVCGTPQVFEGAAITRNLERILEAAASTARVRINIGAGSFYFDAFDGDRRELDAAFARRAAATATGRAYARYAGFDLCTCRDFGAAAALRAVGVDVVPLPCPGFFSAIFQPRPLFRRPEQLVSVLNGTASFWNRVDGDAHDFYRRLHAEDPARIFLAHDEQDCTMLADLGIPYVTFDDADALIDYLAASDRLLSLRVHGALPAWTLGLDVTLLGIDRRALLGDDFGARFRVIALRNEDDFRRAGAVPVLGAPQQGELERQQWLRHYLGLYVGNIRQVVARKLGRPLPDGVPLHAGGRPDPHVPAITAPAGRYFQDFFHTRRSSFEVRPATLQSEQRHEVVDGSLVVTRSAPSKTLVFGPYILLPKGSWRLDLRLRLEPPAERPADGAAAAEGHRLVLQVLKGVPGRVLAADELDWAGGAETRNIALVFENGSDTGVLETVLSSRRALPEGTRVVVESLRLAAQHAAAA